MTSKKELKIKQLTDQSNYQKFEINLLFLCFFTIMGGLIAILAAFLPLIHYLDIQLGLITVILFLMTMAGIVLKPHIFKRINKIKELSNNIERIYEELQK